MPVLGRRSAAADGRRMLHPLRELTLARVREFLREPEAVFWTFFFPVIMALALALAFRNRGEEPVQVAVLAGPGADSVAAVLAAWPTVDVRVLPADSAALALRRGEVMLLVTAGEAGHRFRYDPTRQESRIARLVAENALQAAAGRRDPVRMELEPVRERGSRYVDFLIPGLIGLNLMNTGLWSVGFTVVQMRKEQLLKRYLATPLRRSDFLLSFMLARLVFLVFELGFILAFAVFVFGVPVHGPLLLVVALAMLAGFSFTALGLLIASRTRTTESVQGWMNLVSVPMWVLSGVFFSSENFPALMQPFIQVLPLTAAVDALRAVMLEGAGLLDVAGDTTILLAWGAVTLGIALPIFRWR